MPIALMAQLLKFSKKRKTPRTWRDVPFPTSTPWEHGNRLQTSNVSFPTEQYLFLLCWNCPKWFRSWKCDLLRTFVKGHLILPFLLSEKILTSPNPTSTPARATQIEDGQKGSWNRTVGLDNCGWRIIKLSSSENTLIVHDIRSFLFV